MNIRRVALSLTLLIVGNAPVAAQGWNPLETREDAWRRQQSQDYQFQRTNPNSLNPRTEPLGDQRIPPPSSFNSFGQPQWGGGQPAPFGSGSSRPNETWRR